jgi:methylmalonyl-CoA mutase
MIKIENDFPSLYLNDWFKQLEKDLPSDQIEKLIYLDEFQDLKKNAILNLENTKIEPSKVGQFPFTRGYGNNKFDYYNSQTIFVEEEEKCNLLAIECLMKGCSSIHFDLGELSKFNAKVLFKDIDFRYISCFVCIKYDSQYHILKDFFGPNFPENFFLSFDYFEFQNKDLLNLLAEDLKLKQSKTFVISGHRIHDSCANATQEIAFALSVGNFYLNTLLSKGLDIDQALACIHFTFGTSGDYLVEVSKIRAFRKIWSLMVKKFNPKHNCSFVTYITSYTALCNKSFRDQHTNLLRQTAEVLSAMHAGVDCINVMPYENLLTDSDRKFSRKMAINIPLILIEESKINAESDALGGSYPIEDITNQLCDNSWKLFCELEQLGGIHEHDSKTYL